MDLDFVRGNFRFCVRSSALIYNSEQNKILLFNVDGRNFYMLPGGRITELEESMDAIKREIKEEIGWDNLEFSFLTLSEEFATVKGYNNHQLNIIYKAIYHEPIMETKFKGVEGDWINFQWVDIGEISQYEIFPSDIKKIILNDTTSNHFIDNLIKISH